MARKRLEDLSLGLRLVSGGEINVAASASDASAWLILALSLDIEIVVVVWVCGTLDGELLIATRVGVDKAYGRSLGVINNLLTFNGLT